MLYWGWAVGGWVDWGSPVGLESLKLVCRAPAEVCTVQVHLRSAMPHSNARLASNRRSYESTELWDVLSRRMEGLTISFVKAERSTFRWGGGDEHRIRWVFCVPLGGLVANDKWGAGGRALHLPLGWRRRAPHQVVGWGWGGCGGGLSVHIVGQLCGVVLVGRANCCCGVGPGSGFLLVLHGRA